MHVMEDGAMLMLESYVDHWATKHMVDIVVNIAHVTISTQVR